jgi:hypothetical protein
MNAKNRVKKIVEARFEKGNLPDILMLAHS